MVSVTKGFEPFPLVICSPGPMSGFPSSVIKVTEVEATSQREEDGAKAAFALGGGEVAAKTVENIKGEEDESLEENLENSTEGGVGMPPPPPPSVEKAKKTTWREGGILREVPSPKNLQGNAGLGLGGRTVVLDDAPSEAGSNEGYLDRLQFVGPLVDDTEEIIGSKIPIRVMVTHGAVRDSHKMVRTPARHPDKATLCGEDFLNESYRKTFLANNTRKSWRDREETTTQIQEARLSIFGIDETGRRVAMHMPYHPYIYVFKGEWDTSPKVTVLAGAGGYGARGAPHWKAKGQVKSVVEKDRSEKNGPTRNNKVKRVWKEAEAEAYKVHIREQLAKEGGVSPDSLRFSSEKRRHCYIFERDPSRPGKSRKWPYWKVEFPTVESRSRAGRAFKQTTTDSLTEKNDCGGKPFRLPRKNDEGEIPQSIRQETPTRNLYAKIEEEYIKPEWQAMERIAPGSWVEVGAGRYRPSPRAVTHSEFDLDVGAFKEVRSLPAKVEAAPILYSGFDIECQRGGHKAGFPSWMAPEDKVFDISNALKWWGAVPPKVRAKCPSLKAGETFLVVSQAFLPERADFGPEDIPTDDPLHITEVCKDEAHLLRRWRDFTHVWLGVDAFTGWNIGRFDFPFLLGRFRVVHGAERCTFMSRYIGEFCKQTHKRLKSNALGFNDIYCPFEAMVLDGFMEDKTVKSGRESNSLRYVAGAELGPEFAKDPVTPGQMFATWDATEDGHWCKNAGEEAGARPSAQDFWKVLRYCAQDSVVAMEIVDRMGYFLANFEMAKASFVPFHILVTSGQQIKVLLLLLNFAHERDYVLNNLRSKLYASTGFPGGTVIQATLAAIFKAMGILDFASLYPSIMRAFNQCFSTFLKPEDLAAILADGTPIRTFKTAIGTFNFVRKIKSNMRVPRKIGEAMKAKGLPVELTENGQAVFHEAIPEGCSNEGEEGVLVAMESYLKNMRDGYKAKMKNGFKKGAHYKAIAKAIALLLDAGLDEASTVEEIEACLRKTVLRGATEKLEELTAWDSYGPSLAKHIQGGGEANQQAEVEAADQSAYWAQEGKNYNARQLTAKIFMNAIFGFSGGESGPYPFYPLAASITEQGSLMIKDCVHYIENVWAGMPFQVVYGDTDSVMMTPIAEGVTVEEARKGFAKLEMELTLIFPRPVEMEYEMLVVRMLRKGPKMYVKLHIPDTEEAARAWDRGDMSDAKIEAKGIQTVRKDKAPWVKRVLSNVIEDFMKAPALEAPSVMLNSLETRLWGLVTDTFEDHDYQWTVSIQPDQEYSHNHPITGSKSYPPPALPCIWAQEKYMPGSGLQPGDRVPLVAVRYPRVERAGRAALKKIYEERLRPPPGRRGAAGFKNTISFNFNKLANADETNTCVMVMSMGEFQRLRAEKGPDYVAINRAWYLVHQFWAAVASVKGKKSVGLFSMMNKEVTTVLARTVSKIHEYELRREGRFGRSLFGGLLMDKTKCGVDAIRKPKGLVYNGSAFGPEGTKLASTKVKDIITGKVVDTRFKERTNKKKKKKKAKKKAVVNYNEQGMMRSWMTSGGALDGGASSGGRGGGAKRGGAKGGGPARIYDTPYLPSMRGTKRPTRTLGGAVRAQARAPEGGFKSMSELFATGVPKDRRPPSGLAFEREAGGTKRRRTSSSPDDGADLLGISTIPLVRPGEKPKQNPKGVTMRVSGAGAFKLGSKGKAKTYSAAGKKREAPSTGPTPTARGATTGPAKGKAKKKQKAADTNAQRAAFSRMSVMFK